MDFVRYWMGQRLSTKAADEALQRDARLLPAGHHVPKSTYLLRQVLGCAPIHRQGATCCGAMRVHA